MTTCLRILRAGLSATRSSNKELIGRQINYVCRLGHGYSLLPGTRLLCTTNCLRFMDDKKSSESVKNTVRPIYTVESSISYFESPVYADAYGDAPVWSQYRRNFKGHFPPETRETCVRAGKISTASPCPICRDEYLVVHYSHTKLLKQFLDPTSNTLLPSKKLGVCQEQYKALQKALSQAVDRGIIETYVPFREYSYKDYYNIVKNRKQLPSSASE